MTIQYLATEATWDRFRRGKASLRDLLHIEHDHNAELANNPELKDDSDFRHEIARLKARAEQ